MAGSVLAVFHPAWVGLSAARLLPVLPSQFFDICKPHHPARIRLQWVGDTIKGEGECFFVFVVNLLSIDT